MIKLPTINLKYVLGVLVKVFGLFRHFVGNQRAKHFQNNRYFAIFQTSNRSRFREAWVEVPKPFRVHPAHIWEQLYRILVILAFIPFLKSVPQCKCFFSFFAIMSQRLTSSDMTSSDNRIEKTKADGPFYKGLKSVWS